VKVKNPFDGLLYGRSFKKTFWGKLFSLGETATNSTLTLAM
jgi:hypothetical protein